MVPGYLNKLSYAKNEGNPKETGKELNFFPMACWGSFKQSSTTENLRNKARVKNNIKQLCSVTQAFTQNLLYMYLLEVDPFDVRFV